MRRPDVKLAWVLVDDQLQPVAHFKGVKPTPLARCPACLERVTLKVNGAIRQPYAAHRPASVCPSTQPESALHQNTKFYLAQQLEAVAQLQIVEHCIEYDNPAVRCQITRTRPFAQAWNKVEVERTLDPLRPDLVLLRNDQPVAAIEVLVTHAVDETKAAVYQRLGVLWVEVRADPALYTPPTAWTPTAPLPATQHSQPWRCRKCEAARFNTERERQQAEHERQIAEFWRRFKPDHFRIIDVYYPYPSGKHHRAIFYVGNLWDEAGLVVEARCLVVGAGTLTTDILAQLSPDTPDLKQRLQAAYEDRKRQFTAAFHAERLDSAMTGWFPCTAPLSIGRNDPRYPPRYHWQAGDDANDPAHWYMPEHARAIEWLPAPPPADPVTTPTTPTTDAQQRAAFIKRERLIHDRIAPIQARLNTAEDLLKQHLPTEAQPQLEAAHRALTTLLRDIPSDRRVLDLSRRYDLLNAAAHRS